MIWDTKDQNWKKALAELQTYYSEHGNLDIKARYETSDGFKLGRWISNLRAKVKTKGTGSDTYRRTAETACRTGHDLGQKHREVGGIFQGSRGVLPNSWKP